MHPEEPGISDLDEDAFYDPIRNAQPDEALAGRWMMLRYALDLLEKRPACCRGDSPKAALLSGLQSCSIRSSHGVSVAFESSGKPHLPSSRELRINRLLDPREWVRFSACNMREDSINLANGTPITNIRVSYDDFQRWAQDREEVFEDDDCVDYAPHSEEAFQHSYIQQAIFAAKSEIGTIEFEKPRGGRPPVYNWPAVLIKFLVDSLYLDTKIDSRSSPTHIAEALQEAFGDPQHAPGTTLTKEYAAKIKAALVEKDKARQSQTRFRP